jgi:tetratricopeptide (TPR) repeat protein
VISFEHIIAFVLGMYASICLAFFRRGIAVATTRTLREVLRELVKALIWPAVAAKRKVVSPKETARTADSDATRSNRYEKIQSVQDIDEAYRLCVEYLNAVPLDLGGRFPHVPYAEVLRQGVMGGEADGPRVLHMLGLIAISRSEHGAARGFLERAARADPRDAEVHNSLGFVLWQEKEFLMATLILARAVDLRPGFTAAQTNLSVARAGYRETQLKLGVAAAIPSP